MQCYKYAAHVLRRLRQVQLRGDHRISKHDGNHLSGHQEASSGRLAMNVSLFDAAVSTNSSRTGWVSEPNMRGSWGILLPCISTLLVCSWSVMHLNLPAKSSTNTEKLIPYLYWCVIGIFGPELAIWAAWRQLLSARALKREIGESKVVGLHQTIVKADFRIS
jgi:hypothetical protein